MILQFLQNIPILHFIIYAAIIFALIIQSIYYLVIFLKPVLWKKKNADVEFEPLSVIICAKNEEANLRKNLPKILEQDYPYFEVIVVNDCSEDDTEMLLGEMEQQYNNLRHTNIELDKKFTHGKKLAVIIGMKSAKSNKCVFTDADCYPISKNWLAEIAKSYVINKQIVLGFGAYEKRPGLLNKIIQYDTLTIAMQYFGFALSGRPYMGVGRNMSYLKQIFFAGKGFINHYHIMSGDDDLFVNENADKSNTAVVLSKDSFTNSVPEMSWRSWSKQKKRHLSSGKYYKKGDKFFLGLEIFSRLLFYISILAMVVFKINYLVIISCFCFRFGIQMIIIKLNMNKLDQKGFWFLTPLLDIVLPIIHLFFIISNKLNTSKGKWK
ncbi:MAG: glycosyltransferase [Salinivirgaceae bacterium]|nr:glycosyltransferase [Salinivirgaceae bacterium]